MEHVYRTEQSKCAATLRDVDCDDPGKTLMSKVSRLIHRAREMKIMFANLSQVVGENNINFEAKGCECSER